MRNPAAILHLNAEPLRRLVPKRGSGTISRSDAARERESTGPNPLNHRDNLRRPASRHGSLNSLLQVALYLPSSKAEVALRVVALAPVLSCERKVESLYAPLMLLDRNPKTYTTPHAPYTLHPAPYTLHPAPCTLHPAPYTLHSATYTLYPTPFALHPTPYTLQPKP